MDRAVKSMALQPHLPLRLLRSPRDGLRWAIGSHTGLTGVTLWPNEWEIFTCESHASILHLSDLRSAFRAKSQTLKGPDTPVDGTPRSFAVGPIAEHTHPMYLISCATVKSQRKPIAALGCLSSMYLSASRPHAVGVLMRHGPSHCHNGATEAPQRALGALLTTLTAPIGASHRP
jgi:hypothetical protein